MNTTQKPTACSTWELLCYFLWLGTFGFGGPVALIGYMQRDIVEDKRWILQEEYIQGLALSQLCPGPVATQVAIYCGWLRHGFLGASIVGFGLILPSFLLVSALAALYMHNVGVSWTAGAFYGVGAAVVAIIFRSAIKLAKITCTNQRLLWVIFLVAAATAPWLASRIFFVFLISGLLSMYTQAPPTISKGSHSFIALIIPTWLFSGLHGQASMNTLVHIGMFFTWAGTAIFGSGLAIIPFMQTSVVEHYKWLTDAQFLDAVSVGLITPGPVVITSAFIGYLTAGFIGALIATTAVFLPCYLFVVLLAPFYQTICKNISVKAFVTGITTAAAGTMLGGAFIVAKQAIIDINTLLICLGAATLFYLLKKIPEPVVIIAAGIAGYLVA